MVRTTDYDRKKVDFRGFGANSAQLFRRLADNSLLMYEYTCLSASVYVNMYLFVSVCVYLSGHMFEAVFMYLNFRKFLSG